MSDESLAQKSQRIREALTEKRESIFASAKPGVDPEQYTEALIQQIGMTPKLAECTITSLAYTLRDSATLGLVTGSVLGFGYAIPRFNKQSRVMEASFQVGYLGLQNLAYESPLIAGVATDTVFDGDEITVTNGTQPEVKHEINCKSRGNAIGYYAVIWLVSGPALIRYFTIQQIEAHRSKYSDDGPAWRSSFDTMARKIALTAAFKHAPLHAVAREVLQREEHAIPENAESFPSGTEASASDLDAALLALDEDGEAPAPSPEEFADGQAENAAQDSELSF